jgi:hypothetical protein
MAYMPISDTCRDRLFSLFAAEKISNLFLRNAYKALLGLPLFRAPILMECLHVFM